ncbi:MAG: hypothetical protein A2882_05480 [Phenylobacterium sp. RIFCSPHIGHO2_01_FULL_70_10]|nr:MAG: hypothetical protein A2882_05480 [Phenylobacterium sp. RIFCSPHIGHO2_01_FULL_70_10]
MDSTTIGASTGPARRMAATPTAVWGSISSPVSFSVATRVRVVSSSLTATPAKSSRMKAWAWGGMSMRPASLKAVKARAVSSASRRTASK